MHKLFIFKITVMILVMAFLTACGGGGNGNGGSANPPAGSSNWDQIIWDQNQWG